VKELGLKSITEKNIINIEIKPLAICIFLQREDGAADIADYEDYPVSNGGDGEEGGEGRGGGEFDGETKERKGRDNNHFDPQGFEKYFMKLEDGIEDEVQVNLHHFNCQMRL
jgi:hypothetical protein